MSETSDSKLETDDHRPIEGEEEGNISIEYDSGKDVEETLRQTKAARQRLRSELRGVASMYDAMTGYSMTKLLDTDIQSLIDKVDALVAEDAEHHELICELVDEVEEISATTIEERIQSHKLVGKMRALERAREAYKMALQTTRMAKTLESTDRLTGHTVVEMISRTRTYMQKIQMAVDTINCKELATMATDLEPRLMEVYRRYDEALEALPPKPDATPVSTSATDSHSRGIHFKVPLHKFDGNILHWRDFWKLFDSMLSKDKGLTDVEKICLLRDAMEDPIAKDHVNRAHGRYETYVKVTNELKAEYDRCRIVYLKHADKLFKRHTYEYTQKDMKALVERLETHLQGMERCKGYTLNQYVAAQVELQMGDEMNREWGVYSGDVDCPPDVDTILKFLKKRMRTLPDEPKRVIRPVATPVRLREPRKSTVFRMKEMTSLPICGACDKSHATHLCEVLKGQSVPGRYALVRRKRLCFNCLSKNHSIANCQSTRTCRECGAKHHSLLHRTHRPSAQIEAEGEATPDDLAVVMSVTQQKKGIKTKTIFRTAIVNVSCGSYRRKVRAVLDTGSALCLVSSRLVNSLRAKKVPAETGIKGIVGTSDCKHQVSLKVESAHQDDGPFISFTANMWDRLQLDPTPAGVKDLRDRPFPRIYSWQTLTSIQMLASTCS